MHSLWQHACDVWQQHDVVAMPVMLCGNCRGARVEGTLLWLCLPTMDNYHSHIVAAIFGITPLYLLISHLLCICCTVLCAGHILVHQCCSNGLMVSKSMGQWALSWGVQVGCCAGADLCSCWDLRCCHLELQSAGLAGRWFQGRGGRGGVLMCWFSI